MSESRKMVHSDRNVYSEASKWFIVKRNMYGGLSKKVPLYYEPNKSF